MARPLDGVRILDLTRLLPGPAATMILSGLGASVDKIEDPGAGDYMRNLAPGAFQLINRDKRSAVVDLRTAEGRDSLLGVLDEYDVLIESFRPGVMAKLGCGWDVLHARSPKLIVCAVSGYGQTGPLAHAAGHDINYLARAGVLGLWGPADGCPAVPGVQLADIAGGGMWAAMGILAALIERSRTGEGTFIDISMTEGAMALGMFTLGGFLAGEPRLPRGGDMLTGGLAAYRTYRTKDGGFMALGALEPKFWASFADGVGLDVSSEAVIPGEHQRALQAQVETVFASRTRAEWEDFASRHDCCLAPVLSLEQAVADSHHRARGTFEDTPGGPTWRSPLAPRNAPHQPAPDGGQHTRDILHGAPGAHGERR